jgi:hypothetical protein
MLVVWAQRGSGRRWFLVSLMGGELQTRTPSPGAQQRRSDQRPISRVDSHPVHSVTEYLDAVWEFADRDECLLRGHRRLDWELEPTLARLPRRDGVTLLRLESDLIDGFKRQYLPHQSRDLSDVLEILAVAQHHGLATRLLDWTVNPLVALWFVVARGPDSDADGVVFMFKPQDTDYVADRDPPLEDIDRTTFFQPRHVSDRIAAQSGWFSVHAISDTKGVFNRLDKLKAYRYRVRRLRIPSEHFGELRIRLDRLGVNESTLFPGLDGLSKHLNWSLSASADR